MNDRRSFLAAVAGLFTFGTSGKSQANSASITVRADRLGCLPEQVYKGIRISYIRRNPEFDSERKLIRWHVEGLIEVDHPDRINDMINLPLLSSIRDAINVTPGNTTMQLFTASADGKKLEFKVTKDI